MTYYTKPSTTFTQDVKARLSAIELSKAPLRKIAIGVAVSCAALMALMVFSPSKSDQTASQFNAQHNAEYTLKPDASSKVPGETLPAESLTVIQPETKAKAIPGTKAYRSVDNAVRDVQMDAMVKSKSLRRAIQSNDNPVKAFFIKFTRLVTLPGLFLGFAFLFSLGFLGFIRPDGEDLGNY